MELLREVNEALTKKLDEIKNTSDIERINKEIQLYSSIINEINSCFSNEFKNIDPNDKESISAMADRFLSFYPADDDLNKNEVCQHIRNLYFNFNGTRFQFENAREDLKALISFYRKELKQKFEQRKNIYESIDTELIEKVLNCFKKDSYKEYYLVCDFSLDEYISLVELVDKLDIDIEAKNYFIECVNLSIASNRELREKVSNKEDTIEEKLSSIVDIEPINKKIEELIEEKGEKISLPYSGKILKSIEYLSSKYPQIDVANMPINSETPIDKHRVKFYKSDLSVALFDLQNFIGPAILIDKKLSQPEKDSIKFIYRYINDRCAELMKKDGLFVKDVHEDEIIEFRPANKEIVEQPEIQVQKNDNVTKVEEIKEKSPIDTKVEESIEDDIEFEDLTDDEFKEIEYAVQVYISYKNNIEMIGENTLEQYHKSNFTSFGGYKDGEIDLMYLLLKFNKRYKLYSSEHDSFLNADYSSLKEKREYYGLLDSDKSELLSLSRKIIEKSNEINIMNSNEDNLVNIRTKNNFVIILNYEQMDKDIKEIMADGIIKIDSVLDSFDLLRAADIGITSNLSKVKPPRRVSNTEAQEFVSHNPHRIRNNTLRLCYIALDVSKNNIKELKEKYGITSNNCRVLVALNTFIKRDEKTGYDNAYTIFKKFKGTDENDEYTIEWIKGIFNRNFNDKTRSLAFELIDSSLSYINNYGNDQDQGQPGGSAINYGV